MEDATTLALVSIVGAVITALFKLLNDNTKATNNMATSHDKVAEAIVQGNLEAKERNGHLGDQSLKIIGMMAESRKDTLQAINDLKVQHVDKQIVQEQTVEHNETL